MASTTGRMLFTVALRNVRRNWRHSLAALGTMAVGFIALALFQGYLDELMESQVRLIYARNMIGEVMVRKPRTDRADVRINPHLYRLNDADVAFVEAFLKEHADKVLTRVRVLVLHGIANAGGGSARVLVIGYDVPEGEVARRNWKWNTWAGHPLRPEDKGGVVLGMGLGTLLGCDPDSEADVMDPATGTPSPVERPFTCKQKTIYLTASSAGGRLNALDAEVVGITKGNIRQFDQTMAWIPLEMAQELGGTTGVNDYQILLKNPADADAMRMEMRVAARKASLDLEVMDWQDSDAAETLRRGMELLAIYRTLMVVVILIIAGAAVLTTMMKTVRERTREVGTLRSLGFLSRHMVTMFCLEAAILSVLSGAVGLVGALGVIGTINRAGIMYRAGLLAESIPLRVGYSPSIYAWGFMFLALVAVLAAFLAARRVARMSIALALADG